MMQNSNSEMWRMAIEGSQQCGIQLSKKWIHEEDKVERDEGIWLYSKKATKTPERIDIKPFFKELPLDGRIELITLAKKIQVKYIKNLIAEETGDIPHRGFNEQHALEYVSAEFKKLDGPGLLFTGNIPHFPYCLTEWVSASSTSRKRVYTRILDMTIIRFDAAIKRLKDLDYITTNHDFK